MSPADPGQGGRATSAMSVRPSLLSPEQATGSADSGKRSTCDDAESLDQPTPNRKAFTWGSGGCAVKAWRWLSVFVLLTVPVAAFAQEGGSEVPTGSLVVDAQAPIGSESDIIINARAAGLPMLPVTLVDEGGLAWAVAESAPEESCRGEQVRLTGHGLTPWCILISGLSAGSTVSGMVSSGELNLSLSVRTKNPFLWGPLLTMAGGIAAWLVLLWLTTLGGASSATARYLIRLRIRRNEMVGRDGVSDMDSWEKSSILKHPAVADALREASKGAATRAPGARDRLNKVLEPGNPLPVANPIQALAIVQSGRTDNMMSDFVNEKGELVPHPADVARSALEGILLLWHRTEAVEGEAARVKDPAQRLRLLRRCDSVRGSLRGTDATSLPKTAALVDMLEADLAERLESDFVGPLVAARPSERLEAKVKRRGLRRAVPVGLVGVILVVISLWALTPFSAEAPGPLPSPTSSAPPPSVAPSPAATPSPIPPPTPVESDPILLWVGGIALLMATILGLVLWFVLPLRRSGWNLTAGFLAASAATITVVIVSLGVAVATGWAKWATTPTFGLVSDYVALVVATVGSATIAGLASALVVLARRRFA